MPIDPTRKTEPRDLFRGALEMMVLQSLQRQPMHGYALVQHTQQRSNDLLQVEEGSLYPALQRLLRENLVKAAWRSPLANVEYAPTASLRRASSTWNARYPASSRC